ncbi:MAG: hypothetical protein IT562_05325 [Alphaproteobacteria bacterium]|nr:hypothetical protein [Alphaproteobacteria bacterium]
MTNALRPFSDLDGVPRRDADKAAPDLRARAATIPIVVGGLVVWGAILLLML